MIKESASSALPNVMLVRAILIIVLYVLPIELISQAAFAQMGTLMMALT